MKDLEFETEEFVPSCCKEKDGIEPKFSGSIRVRVPDIEERYKVIEEVGMIDTASAASEAERSRMWIRHIGKAAKIVKEYVVSSTLKRVSDGKEFKTYREISLCPGLDSAIVEIATHLAQSGFVEKN